MGKGNGTMPPPPKYATNHNYKFLLVEKKNLTNLDCDENKTIKNIKLFTNFSLQIECYDFIPNTYRQNNK